MEKFSYRMGNLEVRSTGDYLISNGEHNTAEIIEWFNGEYINCYVLAYWVKGSEGYDLHFVGDRPFNKTINKQTFMKFAELGQEELNILFNTLTENLQ